MPSLERRKMEDHVSAPAANHLQCHSELLCSVEPSYALPTNYGASGLAYEARVSTAGNVQGIQLIKMHSARPSGCIFTHAARD